MKIAPRRARGFFATLFPAEISANKGFHAERAFKGRECVGTAKMRRKAGKNGRRKRGRSGAGPWEREFNLEKTDIPVSPAEFKSFEAWTTGEGEGRREKEKG